MSARSLFFRLLTSKLSAILIGLTVAVSACETPDGRVIDPAFQPPSILSATVSPSIVNTDSMNVGPVRLPDDILTITLLGSAKVDFSAGSNVRYSVSNDSRLDAMAEGQLRNDGAPPDSSASDSLFTGVVQFQIQRSFVGKLMLELRAQNVDGVTGTSFVQIIAIQRLNQPPVLSNLQAPDTVQLSTQQSFVFMVQVNDPDGAADILSVTRQTPAGNLFPLNDSGANGDVLAGDRIYTETVSLNNPPPDTGSYSFQFKALDRSNAQSNIILHTVVVIP